MSRSFLSRQRYALALAICLTTGAAGIATAHPEFPPGGNPSVTLDVTPNDGDNLASPATINVIGAGFGTNTSGDIVQCTFDSALQFDVCSNPLTRFTGNGAGVFTQATSVTRTFTGLNAQNQTVQVDCLQVACTVQAISDSGLFLSQHHLTFAPPPVAGGRYTPLPPARILDTRDGTGGIAGPIAGGATVEVQITGRGGLPASGVSAVAMNVTATQPTGSGFLTIFPAGSARPLAANLNFTPGKTVPNLVVVKLGAGGKVAMFNSTGSTHVVYDVAGWYSDSGTGNAGRYNALAPARILDTRNGTGGGVRLSPGASLDVQVSGRGGVPAAGVQAAVFNLAATVTTATSFLTVHPTGTARPLAANLNFNAGNTVSNRAMVKLGTGGKVTIFNHAGSADVIVDVGGWFTDATVAGSGALTALTPARVLDTRDGTGGFSGPVAGGTAVDVQVTGRGGVPVSGVSAVIFNATVVGPSGPGFLTISPTGTARPVVSDLNYTAGEIRPNLAVVRVGTGGKVNLFTSATTQVVFDVAGWIS